MNYINNMENNIAIPITLDNKNVKRHLLTIPYQAKKGMSTWYQGI